MNELPLSPQVFSILSSLVEERAGISCSLAELEIFASKASARAIDAGFDSMLDYYYFLRYDAAGQEELDRLVEALTVHETFFFRELEPLSVLVTRMIKQRIDEGRRVRIWCAACSTGEEPLTLAMLLAHAGLLSDVELIASDVSSRVLARAQASDYGVRTLRRLPIPDFAKPYMLIDDKRVQVSPALLAAIEWRRINLVEPAAVLAIGAVDVILCRNVLIYFREELVKQVVASLSSVLVPDGLLMVGVSESLMRLGTSFSCEEHGGSFFYRKATAP